MIDADEMVALIESCRREMQAMLPVDEFASLSSKTRQDYRQLGRTLLQRARYAEGGVAEVMTATQLKWSTKIGHSFRVLPEQPFRFIRCQTAVVLMGT